MRTVNSVKTSWVLVSLSIGAFATACSGAEPGASTDGSDDGPVARVQWGISDAGYAPDPNGNLANPERGVAYRIGSGNAGDVDTLKFHFLYLGSVCNQSL